MRRRGTELVTLVLLTFRGGVCHGRASVPLHLSEFNEATRRVMVVLAVSDRRKGGKGLIIHKSLLFFF